MENGKSLAKRCIALCSVLFMMVVSPMTVSTAYADDLEDNIGGNASYSSNSGDLFDDVKNQQVDDDDQGVINWLSDNNTMTSEHLSSASNAMSPVLNIIGYLTGGVIVLTVAGVALITALDLLYIAIPPVRNILYSSGSSGISGAGMNRGSYGFGGMNQSQGKSIQWVSDEAVACASMIGGSSHSMGMNSMGAMGSVQQNQGSTGSVISVYFRKRLFFILLLAICIVVLTSSAIMDCGVNLAEWVLKLIGVVSGKL